MQAVGLASRRGHTRVVTDCEHDRQAYADVPEAGWFCTRCPATGGWEVDKFERPRPKYIELGEDMVLPQGTVAAVHTRANRRCERCGTDWSDFWSMHHRRPRGMGGSKRPEVNAASNILLLCGSGTTGCHGWVESNREEAYELGLLVHKWQMPVEVPVTLWHGTFLLDDDGGLQPC
jgi:hypothetical protein